MGVLLQVRRHLARALFVASRSSGVLEKAKRECGRVLFFDSVVQTVCLCALPQCALQGPGEGLVIESDLGGQGQAHLQPCGF